MDKNIVVIFRMVDCGFCHGTGFVTRYLYIDHPHAETERHPYTVLCSVCHGSGKRGEEVSKERGQHD